jgi:hypothetical protein
LAIAARPLHAFFNEPLIDDGFMRDRVVNLDGRVNFEALGRRHDMAQYLREKDIRWFADWPFLAQEYLGPDPVKSGWSPVATKGSMTLYRYDGR